MAERLRENGLEVCSLNLSPLRKTSSLSPTLLFIHDCIFTAPRRDELRLLRETGDFETPLMRRRERERGETEEVSSSFLSANILVRLFFSSNFFSFTFF